MYNTKLGSSSAAARVKTGGIMDNEFLHDILPYLPQHLIEKWAGDNHIYIPHAAVKIRRNEEIMQKFQSGADRRQLAREYNISRWEMSRIINRKSAGKVYILHIEAG